MCCNSWGHKESDTTERLNWTEQMRLWWLQKPEFQESSLCPSKETKEKCFTILEAIMCPMVSETREIFNSTFMAFGNSCKIQNVGSDAPWVCGNQIKVVSRSDCQEGLIFPSSFLLPNEPWGYLSIVLPGAVVRWEQATVNILSGLHHAAVVWEMELIKHAAEPNSLNSTRLFRKLGTTHTHN